MTCFRLNSGLFVPKEGTNRRACRARHLRIKAAGGSHRPGRWRRIAERDGLTCWLCGGSVNPTEPATSKWSPTVDHVLPLVMGGSDDDGNLRLAHRSCNSRKKHRAHVTSIVAEGCDGR